MTGELQRERVDIILWDPNPREFIRNALSPAKVGNIDVNPDIGEAKVNVGNDQLSLAIGKGGQNVRLAAKLTGFKIDLVASEHVSDLDAALQAVASRTTEPSLGTDDAKRAAFEALFSAAPDPKDDAEETASDGETERA